MITTMQILRVVVLIMIWEAVGGVTGIAIDGFFFVIYLWSRNRRFVANG